MKVIEEEDELIIVIKSSTKFFFFIFLFCLSEFKYLKVDYESPIELQLH